MKKISLFIAVLSVVIWSCGKHETVPSTIENDQSYFPLKSGYWIEYEVDSVVHLDIDDRNMVDTSIDAYHFFVREMIDSSFTDATGKTAWRISRYRRTADSLPWTFMAVWTANKSLSAAEKVEDNQRYVKLSFPFNSRREWNGNAYNSYPEELYSYDNLYEPAAYNSLNFDSSITVVQNDFISSINRIYKIEKYASQVGMIYKQTDSLRTTQTPVGTLILNGYTYRVTIKDYQR